MLSKEEEDKKGSLHFEMHNRLNLSRRLPGKKCISMQQVHYEENVE